MSSATVSPVALAVHEEALAACRSLRQSEHAVAVLLARIHAEKLHRDLGFANALDYAEQALDLARKKAAGLLRLGRSLQGLPELDRAWAAGELDWTKARDMLPVLTADNEAAWVERACTVTNEQLGYDLKVTLVGEPPPSHVGPPKKPALDRLVFHATSEDAEAIRAVLRWARANLGPDSDDVGDGELLAGLLQRVVHDAPKAEAPSGERYRRVVRHCPECRETTGLRAELTDTEVLLAHCDAEVVDLREGPRKGSLTHDVPPRLRRIVLDRDGYACRVPGCSNRIWVDVHHVVSVVFGGRHETSNLVTLCRAHHTLVHDGRLGIEYVDGDLVFRFPDERVRVVPLVPPAVTPGLLRPVGDRPSAAGPVGAPGATAEGPRGRGEAPVESRRGAPPRPRLSS